MKDNIFLVYYTNNILQKSTFAILIMMLCYVLTTLPIITYCYFNIYNINYSKYLQDLFNGLGMGEKFEGVSIFIYRSCMYKERDSGEYASLISYFDDADTCGLSVLNQSSIEHDIHTSHQKDTEYFHEFIKLKSKNKCQNTTESYDERRTKNTN